MRSGTAPVSARAVVVSEAAPKKFEIAIEVESPALTALEHGFDDYLQRLGEPATWRYRASSGSAKSS